MENLEQQASTFFGNKEYEKALEIYQLLFKDSPKNETYAIACGICYDSIGNKELAAEYYAEALRINRKSEAALLNLSTTYYELKDFEKCDDYARRVLDINPKNPSAWQNLANMAFCDAKYDLALEYYQEMYKNNPNSYIAMINIANTYYSLNKYVLALEFAKKSLNKHPSSSAAHILAANSLNAMGKYEKAIDMYMRAFELDSENIDLLNSMSETYHYLSDWENCLLFAWRYLKASDPNSNVNHLNFGYLLYECYSEKSKDLAQKYAAKWLKYFPDNKIVQHMANALTDGSALQESDAEFIKETFDSFAPEFEKTLANLEYQAPELIRQALEKNLKTSLFTKYHILDLGCGTGLCGEKIKKFATMRGLLGVDLSEKMLEIAREKKLYAELFCDDLCHYMENSEYFFHVIVAADVLTYFGDLTKVCVRVARSLTPDGLFVFTFSENEINKEDFYMAPSGRFVHAPSYVERVLKSAGLKLISSERHILRNEAESPVYGYVTVAQKPDLAQRHNS